MGQKVRDWTKYIVPIKYKNKYNGQYDSCNDTTDFITLPSFDEVKDRNQLAMAKNHTDFSILNGGECSKMYGISGSYCLRSGDDSPLKHVDFVTLSGQRDTFQPSTNLCSISPIFTLRLPHKMPAQLAKLWLGDMDKVEIDGKEYFRLYLGEFPRTKVSVDLEKKLESQFTYNCSFCDLHSTGRLYESSDHPQTLIYGDDEGYHRFCPEFEYEGQKYVRVRSNQRSDNACSDGTIVRYGYPAWVKVEPVRMIVRNSDQFARGQARELQLEAEEIVMSGIPFYPLSEENNHMWQNSMIRAYLNSAQTKDLDGNLDKRTETNWDFRNGGFLQSAFDMTREPLKEYRVPQYQTKINNTQFEGCSRLEKIIIPQHVTEMDEFVFTNTVDAQIVFEGINPKFKFDRLTFSGIEVDYVYISKDGNTVILSPREDIELDKTFYKLAEEDCYNFSTEVLDENFRKNFVLVNNLKDSGKLKFMPPNYTLKTFPNSQFENYFLNNNDQRWGKLVKSLKLDTLEPLSKENALTDLLKIYYAIGGFSANQGESERAMQYIKKYVAVSKQMDADPEEIGEEIHRRFSGLILNGPYNPTFASFFMKYYKDNPDFMAFYKVGPGECIDYLCSAHNNFERILEHYPNRVVNGNEERSLLTPRFVAEHCIYVDYEGVEKGNECLADMCGMYGYTQVQFDHIQQIYDKAKKTKNDYIISADKAKGTKGITFRVLDKDELLGFFLGDITNCCQHVGDAAESCVDDGYLNPHAGFIVFEQSVSDKNGKSTDEKRILGQAYIWYDPKTKTVCYDNIEIPTKVLEELKKGQKHGDDLSSTNLLDTVVESADAIMSSMNRHGFAVERVTTGEGYNDLVKDIKQRFGKPEKPPRSMHRNYSGYSDAKNAQYVIRTFDETTKYYVDSATAKAGAIKKDIESIKSKAQYANQNLHAENTLSSEL